MDIRAYDRLFREGDIVRHFKGNFYRIICYGEHSETGEPLMVYQGLYPPYKTYIRPYSMFSSLIDVCKYPKADQPYRFMKVYFASYGSCKDWVYAYE